MVLVSALSEPTSIHASTPPATHSATTDTSAMVENLDTIDAVPCSCTSWSTAASGVLRTSVAPVWSAVVVSAAEGVGSWSAGRSVARAATVRPRSTRVRPIRPPTQSAAATTCTPFENIAIQRWSASRVWPQNRNDRQVARTP